MKKKLRFNLQFFAEGGGADPDPTPAEKDTYTKEEAIAFAQAEADKRVTQALKTQQEKAEREAKKQKTLSGLDAEERLKAENEARIKGLEEELAKYRLTNTKTEVAKVLGNRGLDIHLVDFVVTTEDTDECIKKIDTLDKIFKAMVKKEVDAKLKAGATTPKGGFEFGAVVTKEQFMGMSIAQQAHLAQTNRELYDTLTKR